MTTMKHDPDSLPGRDVDMPASPPGSDYSESPPPKERKAKPKAAPKAPKVKAEVAGDSDGRAPKSSPKKSAWTNERRAQLLEYIIDQGTKSGNLQFIADQIGVTKSQVQDQLKVNRANLRQKAVEAVKNGAVAGSKGGKE